MPMFVPVAGVPASAVVVPLHVRLCSCETQELLAVSAPILPLA
ncbi:hypothetical protein PR003_g12968 [Phytophthora rubi]|uniref:Uncharacterized protein n=1 Tax=Phytophthora rubi TaxID=129364 RepID=A0A6A4FIT4_9STRA|nr:hypothetical protein PR003_g12968 [Phytophthora rubi]